MSKYFLKIWQVDIAHRMAEYCYQPDITQRLEKVSVVINDLITTFYVACEVILGEPNSLFECIISCGQTIAMHPITFIIVKIGQICKLVVGEIATVTIF